MGQSIYFYEETDTTNNRARELALEGAPEGTLVVAEKQTAGRGRRGKVWESPLGTGIWMSLVLRPQIIACGGICADSFVRAGNGRGYRGGNRSFCWYQMAQLIFSSTAKRLWGF